MKSIKRILATVLILSLLLSGCASRVSNAGGSEQKVQAEEQHVEIEANKESGDSQIENEIDGAEVSVESVDSVVSTVNEEDIPKDTKVSDEVIEKKEVPEFYGLNDSSLLQYVEDRVYAELESNFADDDYIVNGVEAVYISQDYLDELAFNSKSNIYFGYTLEEIESQYNGTKYIFTLGEDGTTVVQPFEDYDDTFEQVVKNVAIGSGVILICVTVSVVTAGVGAPAVSMVFAAAASTGTSFALSSSVISAATTAAVTGFQTKDPEETMKAALLSGSESFKWGAITGAILGGASEAIVLKNASQTATQAADTVTLYTGEVVEETIPTPRQAELLALEKYKGSEQITYLAGEEVPWGTPGGTRPDVVRTVGDHLEAIEVKDYDLVNNSNELFRELTRQITDRVTNLPPGSTQRIVLNVQGRGYTQEFVNTIIETIQTRLIDVYPNIPVDIMGAVL